MKCSLCAKEAVTYRRYEGRSLCRSHFFRAVEREIARTIAQNRLIERHDHIAAAISGGKDSLLILRTLETLSKKRTDLKISAILIDEGIKGYRSEGVAKAKQACKAIGVKLHIA